MNMDLIRNAVAEAARQFGAEEYELTITDKENTGVEALKKEISSVSYARSGSMMVRCVVGGKSGYAASELLTPEAAAQIVETACDNALVLDDADQVGLFPGSDRYETSRDRCIELPDADSLKDRALRLLELAYAADEKVIDGSCTTRPAWSSRVSPPPSRTARKPPTISASPTSAKRPLSRPFRRPSPVPWASWAPTPSPPAGTTSS